MVKPLHSAQSSIRTKPVLIDSHCHLDFESLRHDCESLLDAAAAVGVETIVIPSVTPAQWPLVQTLCEQSHASINLYGAAGLHPWWVESFVAEQGGVERALYALESRLEQSIAAGQCIAIGECGLDSHIDAPLSLQRPFFELQLDIARRHNLPVIVHAVKAHAEVQYALRQIKDAGLRGVVHAFTGSKEMGEQYWRLGFYLGIGGTISYERAAKTRRAVAALPLESLLLETDAPDMPLSGFQGEVNRPEQVARVAQSLAQLRGESLEEVAAATTANAKALFRLP